MKLYTTYTPSHKGLFENYFLRTLPAEFDLCAEEDPEQACPSGCFYQAGWDKTCYKKIVLFLKACEENLGGVFFYCGVDVQFFGNVVDQLLLELEDFDIACQDDVSAYCSGLFVCKASEKTLRMFEAMKANYEKEDQATLNEHLHMCKHKKLSDRFFTYGHVTPRPWQGEKFAVPEDILIHHANFVIGVEQKMEIMDYVRAKLLK